MELFFPLCTKEAINVIQWNKLLNYFSVRCVIADLNFINYVVDGNILSENQLMFILDS